MKHLLRVPTVEYGFIEEEFEGTADAAYERFNELLGICRGGVGLPGKEWTKVLDKYLAGEGCTPEEYYKMNKEQQLLISEIKKAFRRLNKQP